MSQYQKFDAKAESYVKGRPTYPDEALEYLYDKLALRPEMTVADIGAGTGLLTQSLRRFFADVIAIEPNDEMRSYLGPGAIAGTAEETTLPNQSINAVFAAQAFHWFDLEKTRQEFRRILQPPCSVALLWNDRLKSGQPGLHELDLLMKDLSGAGSPRLQADDKVLLQFFESRALNKATFENPVDLDRESFRAMVLSRSYAPKTGTTAFVELTRKLDEIFAEFSENGDFRIPYRTTVYWGQLTASI